MSTDTHSEKTTPNIEPIKKSRGRPKKNNGITSFDKVDSFSPLVAIVIDKVEENTKVKPKKNNIVTPSPVLANVIETDITSNSDEKTENKENLNESVKKTMGRPKIIEISKEEYQKQYRKKYWEEKKEKVIADHNKLSKKYREGYKLLKQIHSLNLNDIPKDLNEKIINVLNGKLI
jgi:hypothetical protein